jgi:hypothetical protein
LPAVKKRLFIGRFEFITGMTVGEITTDSAQIRSIHGDRDRYRTRVVATQCAALLSALLDQAVGDGGQVRH